MSRSNKQSNAQIVRRAADALMAALCSQDDDVQIGHGIAAAWALFFTLWRENGGSDSELLVYVASCLRDEPVLMREQSKLTH